MIANRSCNVNQCLTRTAVSPPPCRFVFTHVTNHANRDIDVPLGVQVGTWYQIPTKPTSQEFKKPKKRVEDLVKMSIAAHRLGHGDIVWTCWQPGIAGAKIKDAKRMNSGAMLIMLTPRGANTVAQRIDGDRGTTHGAMSPGHFDLRLKKIHSKPPKKSLHRAKITPSKPPLLPKKFEPSFSIWHQMVPLIISK